MPSNVETERRKHEQDFVQNIALAYQPYCVIINNPQIVLPKLDL